LAEKTIVLEDSVPEKKIVVPSRTSKKFPDFVWK
jgi:hypothetical protein